MFSRLQRFLGAVAECSKNIYHMPVCSHGPLTLADLASNLTWLTWTVSSCIDLADLEVTWKSRPVSWLTCPLQSISAGKPANAHTLAGCGMPHMARPRTTRDLAAEKLSL